MNRQDPGAAPESRAAWGRLIRNSNWNFAAFGIVVAANFLTVPFVVHRLGMAQFGLAGLILAMLAPLMFIGTVLGQACVRELAPMMAANDVVAARHMFSSALVMCLVASLLVLLAFSLFGPVGLRNFSGVESAATHDLFLVVFVATLGWVAQQMFLVVQSTIVSAQHFQALAIANVASAVASAACVLAATWLLPSVLGFLLGTASGFLLTLLLTALQARRYAGQLFPLMPPRMADVRRILAFCRWQVPAQLSGAFALQADRYLLGSTATMAVVGQFNVATRLQEVVYMGVLKISEVLFPHFSAFPGNRDSHQVSVFMASSWIVNAIAAAALAPLIPLSAALIALWVGASAAEVGAPMLRTLVTAGILGSGINVFSYFAMGKGYTKRLGVMSLAHAATVVVSSTVLILGWGALAAGMGFVVANVLRLVWATCVTPDIIGSRMRVSDVAQSTLLPLAAGLLVGWGFGAIAAGSWLSLLWNYALLAAAVLLGSLVLSVCFPASRTLALSVASGLRGHFSQR